MKPLPLLLAASLVANAALVTTTVIRPSSKTEATGATAKTPPGAHAAGAHLDGRDFAAALDSDDPASLRDLLRAAGVSEDMVRSLVQARIWKRYEARYKALRPKPDPDKPWWKDDPRQSGWYGGNLTRAQRDEMRKLQKEQRDEMERVLGPDKNAGNRGWVDPRLSFLSAEKREQIRQVQQDYQELMGEVQQDAQGFMLPSDREKLRYLAEEQKKDLAALMTPEEREAYELRMSSTAQQLRWKMTRFDATEEEYREIFPLQKAFDDQYNTNDPYGGGVQHDQAFWKARQEAEKQLNEQIKSVVGDERYADYVRSQDNDYQQLQAAARRLDLPPDTATRVYSLRDDVASGAKQINDNDSLSVDQKKQALAALAETTRDQVRAALGQEVADTYFKNNGMSWLQQLERGQVVTFSKDSTNWSTTSLRSKPSGKK